MKKLYHRKGQVHPSPSPSPSPSSPCSSSQNLDHFSLLNYLPAAILTLVASLSSEDKQVLAYLLSCSSNTPFDFDPSKSSSSSSSSSKKHPQNNNNLQHCPSFSCYCFTCYTSYWARWDSSPNRQLIHEIIDAFEDDLVSQRKKKKNKQGLSRKHKRKNNNNIIKGLTLDSTNDVISGNGDDGVGHQDDVANGSGRIGLDSGRVDPVEEDEEGEKLCDETGEKQGSSVRKIVSFIGDKIWGSVWG